MRLLHTSDWHLGRSFHGASLLDEQREAVERIVALAGEHEVDLVVIAGDLYDRAIPPAEAVTLFDDALVALHATGARVVAISGNHDSAARVSVHDRLLEASGVSIRGDADRITEPVTVPAADGGPPVHVYAIPYLEPTLVAERLRPEADAPANGGEPGEAVRHARATQAEVMRWAAARIRADLATREPARSVLLAHSFVVGGISADSERGIVVGTVEYVPLDVFDGFDYVALGHLHGPQTFGDGRVAYSGTPLPYSYSEEHQTKSVRIVELAPDGGCTVEVVPLGVGRPLQTIRGRLDDLLTSDAYADAEAARVRAVLEDELLPQQAMARLRERFPHAAELRHEPARQAEPASASSAAMDEETTPEALVGMFWEEVAGQPPSEEVRDLLAKALRATLTKHAGTAPEGTGR